MEALGRYVDFNHLSLYEVGKRIFVSHCFYQALAVVRLSLYIVSISYKLKASLEPYRPNTTF